MNIPRISVLISTFNRAPLLDNVLQSFCMQTLPAEQFELVIVDDGSSDDTEEVVCRYVEKLSIRYVYQENTGLAAGKNHAVQLSSAPIILFMDDDDIADKLLLEEHLSTHAENPAENIAVLGFTDLQEDIASSPLMHFVTQVGYYLFCYPKLRHGSVLDYTYFWGGRSSCKKNFLLAHGLFDPEFHFGCEDIELGYRLSMHGLKVIYNKNARSTMIRAMSLSDFCKRVEHQGHSNTIFTKKHPVPEIKLWADIGNLEKRWKAIEPCLAQLYRRAEELEKIVQSRSKYGVLIDELLLSMLHNAYWTVIDGFRLKGSWGGSQE